MLLNSFVLIVIFFFLGLIIGGCAKPFYIRRFWYALSFVFVLSLAVLGFRLEPHSGLDLYRLNMIVDNMRLNCDSLMDALTPTEEDIYGSLTFFRIICYFVSRLDSNGWLPFISILTTMSLLLWTLINYLRSENYSTRMILPSMAIMLMGMQLQYIFSGVRNAMAVAFVTVGLYLLLYKKKHYILAVLLCVMAVTTHPVVLALVPVLVLCWIPKGQLIFRVMALLSLPLIFAVAEIMIQMPVTLLQSIGTRILYYTDRSYLYDRPEMIANCIMFLTISLGYWLIRYVGRLPKESRKWNCYMNAYNLLGCMMIGCMGRRDFALRIGYLMGVAAVPILCRLFCGLTFEKNIENRKIIQAVIMVISVALMGCCAKVFYDTFVVMGQWEFKGF